MLYLPVMMAAAAACLVALLAVSQKSEAAFPGKNGRIVYAGNGVIYTITLNPLDRKHRDAGRIGKSPRSHPLLLA
jgi:hypothetical protein